MRRILPVVLLATAGLALVGCSSKNVDSPTVASTTTSTAATAAATASSTTTTAPQPSLSSLLLSVNELPAGWAVDNSPDSSTSTGCFSSATHSATSVNVQFAQGGSLPILFQVLDRQTDATQTFQKIETMLNGCKTFSTSDNGTTHTFSVGAMSFPAQADQSVAYNVNGSVSGVNVNIAFVMMRKGDYLMLVGLGDIGSVDTTMLQTFIGTALNKLPA